VGLSEQEQKVLEELERQLTGNKPSKAKAEEVAVAPVKYARLLVLGSVLIVVGLSLMIFATSLQLIWFGVAAFVTMLTGLYLVSQNWSSKAIRATKAASEKQKPENKSSGSFFQDRWDQRNEGK
jgi:Flp pilus assembly pilin Flp